MRDMLRQANEPTRRSVLTGIARTALGVSLLRFGSRAWAAEPARRSKAQHVIFLYMAGGMSHIDTLDPKPGTAEGGPLQAIDTRASGVRISELMPKLAAQMDKAALIRSMHSKEGSHERGTYAVHTSYPPIGSIEHPSMSAWTVRMAGPLNQTLPPNVLIGGRGSFPLAGYMGPAYAPVIVGDPNKGLQNVERPTSVAEVDYNKTLALMDAFDSDFRNRYRSRKVQAYSDFYDRAVQLMASDDVKAFNIGLESEEMRSAYGKNQFGQGCLLARRLVEAGVRFVEVTLGGWDTHYENFDALKRHVPTLDQALATLLADLHSRGLLQKTLVVVASEFGRTPRITERNGRDHHPGVWTTLLAGGGVQGGAVHGSSDAAGDKPTADGVSPQDFNATLAYALGIPHDQVVHDEMSGRPFRMGGIDGKPVTALF